MRNIGGGWYGEMAVPGERNLGVLLSEQRAEVVVMPVREGEMSRPGSDMPSIPMSP